jgi:small subunit ribosomal protein S1
MVDTEHYQGKKGTPPPMDESWWQSVLADDEVGNTTDGLQKSALADKHGNLDTDHHNEIIPESFNWEKATELYIQDQVVYLQISGHNRGGLLVNGDNIQGFLPLSHLVDLPIAEGDSKPQLNSYMDQVLRLKVIECNRDSGRVVLSERAALAEPGSRILLLKRLQAGDCVNGKVTNITKFGIFVDLGGVEGLVHVSEISWGRVNNPKDVISLGQWVDVYVINVDQERARIALSLKRLQPNPWDSAQDRYCPGQLSDAVVTSVVPFGVFARLEEGLDGLIHISEISPDGSLAHPEDILTEGQPIKVRIINVDASRQRLGLSVLASEETE